MQPGFDQRLHQINMLTEAIAAHREELIQAAIADVGFSYRDSGREVDNTVRRLPAFVEGREWLAQCRPVCRTPEDEVALMLPYDGSTWLNIAIASIYLVGNRLRVKFSSKGSRVAALTAELYQPIFGDAVQFDDRPGTEFLPRTIEASNVPAIVVFGSDRHIRPYGDAIRASGKKLVFEGPGNDPFIVLAGAGLDAAVEALLDAKYIYSGQTCTSPERIYVQDTIYDTFLETFVARSRELKMGDPGDPGTDIVPVASRVAVENIRRQLADAIDKGGHILCGGDVNGQWVPQTVVADATQDMLGMQSEIFGPVSFVSRFTTTDEVLNRARENRYGLRAEVWGGPDEAPALAAELKGADYLHEVDDFVFGVFGTVSANRPRSDSWIRAFITRPVGGYGYSGWVWETVDGRFVLKQGPKLLSLETSIRDA